MRFAVIVIACGCAGSPPPPAAAPAETKPLAAAPPPEAANDQVAMGDTKVAGDPDEGGEVTGLSGTGGGGVGEGTIGVGGVGRISSGAGHAAHRPHVTPGTSTVSGNMDPAIVKRIIRRDLHRIQFCYEQQLTTDPTLAGKLIIRFKIGKDGSVIAASTEQSLQGALDACVASSLRAVQFPAPGSEVEVSYPFIFAGQD